MHRLAPSALRAAWLAFGLLAAGPAAATDLSWNITVNGNAGTAANWSPVKVPTATDRIFFDKNAGILVTFDATVPTVLRQTHRAGTISLALSPSLNAGALFTVADSGADVATAKVTTGTLNVSTEYLVGNLAGSKGTFTVDSGASIANLTGASANLVAGQNGTGTVNVTNGGTLQGVTSLAIAGNLAGSTGTFNVSGFSTLPSRSSTLATSGTGDLVVGSQGTGTLNVTGGGAATSARDVYVGRFTGGNGTALVDGTGNGHATILDAQRDIYVAASPSVGAAAGTGSLQASNGALLQALGTIHVGDPSGGTGTLHVLAGASLIAGGLAMTPGHATLDFNGGTIDIRTNPFTPPTPALDLDSAVPEALTLETGATCTLNSPSVNGYSCIVGDAHGATLNLTDSGHLATNAQLAVALQAGATGTLIVQKSAQLTGSGESALTVGLGGAGTLGMFNAGLLTQSVVNLALLAGSSASAHVSGAGTTLTADSIWVGGGSAGKGGTARLLVDSNGLVQTTGNLNQFIVYAGDSVVLNTGGTVNAPNLLTSFGHIALGGGSITGGVLTVDPGGTLSGFGTASTIVNVASGGTIAPSGGTLALGSDAAVNGFINGGTLTVGAAAVTLHSGSPATLGNTTLDLGTIGSSNGVKLAAGKTLSGRGTVNGAITNAGAITATTDGLTFSGLLTNSGGTFAGTKIAFTGTGGFAGAGSLPVTTLVGDATTTITATGPLSLGAGTMGSSVALAGRLVCGANTVTFPAIGTARTSLGLATSLAGGTLQSTTGFTVPSNDTLEGNGTVSGFLANNGVVAPGFSAGTLSVTGDYSQAAVGRLTMEIGRLAADPHDQLNVTGHAALAGTLDLRLLPGTVPQPAEEFTLLTFGSSSGAFQAVSINGQPAGSQVSLITFPTRLVLHVNAITVGVPDDPAAGVVSLGLTGVSGPRAQAAFELALPRAAHVDLTVFDAAGRRVGELWRGDRSAGRARFALADLPARLRRGVYFARAVVREPAGTSVRTARAVLER